MFLTPLPPLEEPPTQPAPAPLPGPSPPTLTPIPGGPTWEILNQPIALPSDATPNAKGNILFKDPITGEPRWVPPEGVKDGQIIVQPRTCSTCALKAATEEAAKPTYVSGVRFGGPYDLGIGVTLGILAILGAGGLYYLIGQPRAEQGLPAPITQ